MDKIVTDTMLRYFTLKYRANPRRTSSLLIRRALLKISEHAPDAV